MPNKYLTLTLLLLAVLVFCGCSKDMEQEGVVATVNGKPIYLAQLEALYDLNNLSWSGGMVPAVDALREDYGNVLSRLIVNELVDQALARVGLSVTDADVTAAEATIRADYPEGQFEKTLVEEYIDIEVWRSRLRQQLAMETLKSDILRPRIKLTSQEAEAYYKANLADFYLPPRVRFLHISGADREHVSKAREMWLGGTSVDEILSSFDGIAIRELRMRVNMMPVNWKSTFDKLKEGESSAVFSGDNGFEVLVLLENLPEKVLGPSHAYPLVEKVLLEQKLQAEFDEWLKSELAKADIRISSLLLHSAEEKAAEEKAADGAAKGKEVPSAGQDAKAQ
ncbi:peptidylprolyl isomerase [Desulfovibrio mangrovi]|uniref:peptidylprolyl isomerase n=1 Tax=Desulfovibrio mangrovi TaxID=2976983 RepID=UPI00224874D9|nr:peptidylprolyl isomerase [Desulfovibrio mangrovi]UZP68368.1 peptidylprolyl isomerase [Desulfovibrio mangrovi]